jgi:CRP/FNR family transcriptional regulator
MKLMRLCHVLEMVYVSKGEELEFNHNNKQVIYFLKSGTVKIVSGETSVTKYLVKKGNIFGELPLFDESPDTDKAIVLEDGVICFIEKDKMKEMMKDFPSLKNDLLKFNGLRIRKLERRLEDLLYKDSQARIREYLFDFVSEFGELNGEYTEAKNLISHTDIASLTNTSRQTVSNVMSKLRKDEIILYDTKTIKINKQKWI